MTLHTTHGTVKMKLLYLRRLYGDKEMMRENKRYDASVEMIKRLLYYAASI